MKRPACHVLAASMNECLLSLSPEAFQANHGHLCKEAFKISSACRSNERTQNEAKIETVKLLFLSKERNSSSSIQVFITC